MVIAFDTGVFISHASNDSGMSCAVPWIAGYLGVVLDVRHAVQGLRLEAKTRSTAEHCLAAFRRLQGLPDAVWDAIEPVLSDEIAELHDLCATDEDLQ